MSKTKRDLLLATTRMIAEYSNPSGAPALGLTLPKEILNAPRLNETITDEDYAWEIAKIGAMLPDICAYLSQHRISPENLRRFEKGRN
ncbi:MAG: hypothetical protein FJ397_10695 [Verrucomicrobia bacterium]|nr:hypothetical protein [Verrucomicrobiota bacterium]